MTTFYPEELPPEPPARAPALAQPPEPASTNAITPPSAMYSSATYPPATYPPATYPPATYPTATYPTATYPPATYPPATYPPATYPRAHVRGPLMPPRALRWARIAAVQRWVVILACASLAFVYIQSQRVRTYSEYERTTFVEIVPGIPPGSIRGLSLAESEELAREFSARPDSNGSFVASGLELAWLFGVNVEWSTSMSDSRCADPNADGTTVAWYCGNGEPTIVLNRDANVMPMHLYNPEFIDTMKHELAHHSIRLRCGTSRPAAAGARPEGVTNSYAIIILDADRGRLEESAEAFPDYQFDATTDAAAREIFLGSC